MSVTDYKSIQQLIPRSSGSLSDITVIADPVSGDLNKISISALKLLMGVVDFTFGEISFTSDGSTNYTYTYSIGTTLTNTNYIVLLTPTSIPATSDTGLVSNNFCIQNKTTTTFDIQYTAINAPGLVNFDFILIPKP